jgi:hypothetical protein
MVVAPVVADRPVRQAHPSWHWRYGGRAHYRYRCLGIAPLYRSRPPMPGR